jgi:hypothetical protein
VFAQPKLETSFEYGDVRNRIVIDNGFNARPLHWLCDGVIENENRMTRGLPKKALKLRDWHSEGIGNLQYFAPPSCNPDDSLLALKDTAFQDIYSFDWEAP